MKLGHWGKLEHPRGLNFVLKLWMLKKIKNNNIDFTIEFLFIEKKM